MVVTLGQQYDVGEKLTVILYTYINRHAETPDKKKASKPSNQSKGSLIYVNIGCRDESSTMY